MKKIMILGAGTYQVPLIKRAKERGLYTIIVSPEGNYAGLKLNIADKVYHYDVRDEEKILEIAMKEKIDGITTDQTDVAVRTVAYVAEKMNLSGIGIEIAKLFTDKSLMREKGKALGLPTIPSCRTDSLEEAKKFFSELSADAIIKPVDSQGSRGVYRIVSRKDLENKYPIAKNFSRNGEVIIEKYIYGEEYEVDSIVVNGVANTLMCADRELYQIDDIFASTLGLYPSVADKKIVDKLLDVNKRTIEGFGLKYGLTHSEYLRDKNDGEIYLVEAAARGGGIFISSHIAELQSGINTSDFLIDFALGNDITIDKVETNKCHCGYVTFYLPAGEVVSDEGVETIKNKDYVHTSTLDMVFIGSKTGVFTDKTARYIIIIKGSSREELLQHIDEIRNTIKIQVKTKDGLEGPVWG